MQLTVAGRRPALDIPIDIRQIPLSVRQILERLDSRGFESWLVGGCVRDLCLGLQPKDFDLATSALPEQVQELFPRHFATGLEHGTVTVIWDHEAVEITTFRSDGSYTDSRRPDLVVFHDQIDADLSRRDFTMNSMAFRPDRGLLDLHGGLSDLRHGILRSVGEPEARFREDALRMLRAIRFSVTYDLTPDTALVQAAALLANRLERLSRERVSAELLQILGSAYPRHLRDFGGCGLISMAASLLLCIPTDDQILCERLGALVHPDLRPEQRLALFYLVAAAEKMDADGLRCVLRTLFKPDTGHHLQHLLMHESRVSRRQAQTSEAMLYLMFLRLLLPLGQPLHAIDQRRLLRLLARRCHLNKSGLAAVADQSSQLLKLCLAGEMNGSDLRNADFGCGQACDYPLTLAEMSISGRQLLLAGWRSGPAMQILLERLLSRVIVDPAQNRPADLMALAHDLAGRRDRKPANDKNLSCLPGMDL